MAEDIKELVKIEDLERSINEQIRALNGVEIIVDNFIETINEIVDLAITDIRDYYLGGIDGVENAINDLSDMLLQPLENARLDQLKSENYLPEKMPVVFREIIASELDPILADVVDKINSEADGARESLMSRISDLQQLYNGTLKKIKDIIDGIIEQIKSTIKGIIETVLSTLLSASDLVLKDGPGLVKVLPEKFQNKQYSFPNPTNTGDAESQSIIARIEELSPGIGGVILLNGDVLDQIVAILNSGINTIKGITDTLSSVKELIALAIAVILAIFTGDYLGIIDALTGDSIFEEIITEVSDKINELSDKFKLEAKDDLIDYINKNANSVINMYSIKGITEYNNDNLSKLNNAKVSLDSLNEIKAFAGTINREFANYTTPIIKEWIKLLRHIHPEVDKELEGLLYFKPISDDIASRTLGYYPDTQSMDLEDWDGNYPTSVRYNTQYKLPKEDLELINSSYKSLNQAMVKNISTEFYKERAARPIQGNTPIAHDYHIAGDSSYIKHMKDPDIILAIANNLVELLQDSIRLINYLVPINNYGKALIGPVEITIKDKKYLVNAKGVPYQYPITNVDKEVLKPIV